MEVEMDFWLLYWKMLKEWNQLVLVCDGEFSSGGGSGSDYLRC